MTTNRTRAALGLAALAATFLVWTADLADARPGRSGGFGSRGTRTYQAPPPTQTAPNATAPVERSVTQPGQPGAVQRAPGSAAAAQARPGFFSGPGGFMRGLMLGGLLGLVLGHGFGGLAGLFGLLLQLGLAALVVMLALRLFRGRAQPVPAGAARMAEEPAHAPRGYDLRSALGFGQGARTTAAPAGVPSDQVGVGQRDLDAFERTLGEIQSAYGREDLNALRRWTTPEILSYFAEELADNASRGVVNRVGDIALLQGDLAEAWREGDRDYATVAMRYSLTDIVEDRETGRIVEGSQTPVEATELWTFTRARGGSWLLSALQQTG